MDMWTTQGRCPQAHRFSKRNRAEQNEKCVTRVVGQKCHLCSRLYSGSGGVRGCSGHNRTRQKRPSPKPSPTRARVCGTRDAARGEREPTEFAAPLCLIVTKITPFERICVSEACRRRQFGRADLAAVRFGFTAGVWASRLRALTASDRATAVVRHIGSDQDSA